MTQRRSRPDGVTSIGSEVDIFTTAAQAGQDWRLSALALVLGTGVGGVSVVLHAPAREAAAPAKSMNALAALLAKRLVAVRRHRVAGKVLRLLGYPRSAGA